MGEKFKSRLINITLSYISFFNNRSLREHRFVGTLCFFIYKFGSLEVGLEVLPTFEGTTYFFRAFSTKVISSLSSSLKVGAEGACLSNLAFFATILYFIYTKINQNQNNGYRLHQIVEVNSKQNYQGLCIKILKK